MGREAGRQMHKPPEQADPLNLNLLLTAPSLTLPLLQDGKNPNAGEILAPSSF